MLYAAVVLLLGLLATWLSVRALRIRGVLDVPNHRSSHTRPTVRGAGVGVAVCSIGAAIVASLTSTAELFALAMLVTAFSALGLADDLRPMGSRSRLLVQLVIAVVAVLTIPLPGNRLTALVALVALVGYVNAFNFMDGIDGISVLHAAAVGGSWIFAGVVLEDPLSVLLGGVTASAALAFMPFNLPIARAFLGDVGSYFFGGWIAVSAMLLVGHIPVMVVLLPLAPYIADTGWTLVRRVQRGATWHESHREHAYQRIVQAGWSHGRTAGLVGGLTGVCGLLGVLTADVAGVAVGAPVVAAFFACVGYLAMPSVLESRSGVGA